MSQCPLLNRIYLVIHSDMQQNIQNGKQTGRHTDIRTDTDRQTGRLTGKHTDRLAYGQTDADRQKYTKTN